MWEHKWEILLGIGAAYKCYIEHEKTVKRHIFEILILLRICPVSSLDQFQDRDKKEPREPFRGSKNKNSSTRKKDSEAGNRSSANDEGSST